MTLIGLTMNQTVVQDPVSSGELLEDEAPSSFVDSPRHITQFDFPSTITTRILRVSRIRRVQAAKYRALHVRCREIAFSGANLACENIHSRVLRNKEQRRSCR